MHRFLPWFLPGMVVIVACSGDRLTTTQSPAGEVEILPSAAELLQGESVQLTGDVRDGSGVVVPGAAISWSTSDAGVASIDQTGRVTGNAPGSVTIAAHSGGLVATRVLTILSNAPVAIWATSAPTSLDVGNTGTIVVEVHALHDLVISSPQLSWRSEQPQIATVDPHGTVRGLSPGTATIVVSSGSIEAGYAVLVRSVTPEALVIAPQPDTMLLYSTAVAQATVTATDGLPLQRPVTWSATGSVVTITPGGLIQAMMPGTATITARVSSVTATHNVVVLPYSRVYTAIWFGQVDDMVAGDTTWVAVGGSLIGPSGPQEIPVLSSSDSSVILISPIGQLVATGAGIVTVKATSRYGSAEKVLQVFPHTTTAAIPAVVSAQLTEYVGTMRSYVPAIVVQESSGVSGFKVTGVHMTLIGATGEASDQQPFRVNPGATRRLWDSYEFDPPEADLPLSDRATGAMLEITYTDDAGNRGSLTVTAPLASGG